MRHCSVSPCIAGFNKCTPQLHQWLVRMHLYYGKFVSTNEGRAWFVRTNLIEVPWKKKERKNVALCQRPTLSGPLEKCSQVTIYATTTSTKTEALRTLPSLPYMVTRLSTSGWSHAPPSQLVRGTANTRATILYELLNTISHDFPHNSLLQNHDQLTQFILDQTSINLPSSHDHLHLTRPPW